MAKRDYIIAYDIRDKKRLIAISKIMEKSSLRIQRSVYFCEKISKKELNEIIDRVLPILKKRDDLRVYNIKDRGFALGGGIDLNRAYILV